MKNNKVSVIALNSMLIALAFVLSYVESLVPMSFAIPGVKLGLTNLVVLYALYELNEKNALVINIIRIILAGILFGNSFSVAYSMAGGILSFLVMLIMKRLGRFRMVSVSVMGAVSHNIGQILIAVLLTKTKAVIWYFAVLWFSGILSGFIIGIICAGVIKRVRKISK